MFKDCTDAEYVERFRVYLNRRYTFGIPLLLLGIVFISSSIFLYFYAKENILTTLGALNASAGGKLTNSLAYSSGFKSGMSVLSMLVGGVHILGAGISMIVGQRKERLLVEMFDKLNRKK